MTDEANDRCGLDHQIHVVDGQDPAEVLHESVAFELGARPVGYGACAGASSTAPATASR